MKEKQNIILCDCEIDEVKDLKDGLESLDNDIYIYIYQIKSHIANWKRKGKLSEVKRYLKYFRIGFKYFVHRKKYNVIIGWQQFYVLILSYFCSIFHVKKRNKLVVMNFTYKKKNKFGKIYHSFMAKCLNPKYIDYIHVLSKNYATEISKEFNFPLDRIIVTYFGISDHYEEYSKLTRPSKYKDTKYALSIGRSNRDFDFLINSWDNIDYHLVIISDKYEGQTNNPNIEILRDVCGDDSYPWIANCECMIIPIDDGSICSGDTVLLTAMSLKKKVIVTTPSTLAEMYVENNKTAFCINKTKEELEEAMNKIISSSDNSIGENARSCFLENYSRKQLGINVAKAINERR